MIDESSTNNHAFTLVNYRQLAELRFCIRRYLQLSEQVARTHGIEPQQHQLMLTIKGLPANTLPTVSALANRLCLRHHSTVELINRLVDRGAALRKTSTQDRRQVLVELTPVGEELLGKLIAHHNQELQTFAPELLTVLTSTMNAPESQMENSNANSHIPFNAVSQTEPGDSGKGEIGSATAS